MKIQRSNHDAHCESGMAVFLMIALLAIMIILVTANLSALARLHREVKLLEQQQTQRLNASQTNSAATSQPLSK
ncbi:MAG TPA: hypothetical protein VGN23_17020 [Verrucomicrobiae bacterium]|jgi:hypothetical protein